MVLWCLLQLCLMLNLNNHHCDHYDIFGARYSTHNACVKANPGWLAQPAEETGIDRYELVLDV